MAKSTSEVKFIAIKFAFYQTLQAKTLPMIIMEVSYFIRISTEKGFRTEFRKTLNTLLMMSIRSQLSKTVTLSSCILRKDAKGKILIKQVVLGTFGVRLKAISLMMNLKSHSNLITMGCLKINLKQKSKLKMNTAKRYHHLCKTIKDNF